MNQRIRTPRTIKPAHRPATAAAAPQPARGQSASSVRTKKPLSRLAPSSPQVSPKRPVVTDPRPGRLPRRRRPWRYGWRRIYPISSPGVASDYPEEWPDEPSPARTPSGVPSPELGSLSPQARRFLGSRGLLAGAWHERLRQAPPGLTGCINRFYGVTGFEFILGDYFGHFWQRAGAVLALRLAQRIAERHSDFRRRMSFEREISLAPGGIPYLGVDLSFNDRRYRFLPGSRIDALRIRRQIRRDQALHGGPHSVRWVFDGRRLQMERRDLIRMVGWALSGDDSGGELARRRRWLDALERLVVVI